MPIKNRTIKLEWTNRQGTLARLVREAMERLNFEEIEQWHWHHEGLDTTLDLQKAEREEAMHVLREAARWKAIEDFKKSGRREADELICESYEPSMAKRTREVMKTTNQIQMHLHLILNIHMA